MKNTKTTATAKERERKTFISKINHLECGGLGFTQHTNHSLSAFVVGHFSFAFCGVLLLAGWQGTCLSCTTALQGRAFLHGHTNSENYTRDFLFTSQILAESEKISSKSFPFFSAEKKSFIYFVQHVIVFSTCNPNRSFRSGYRSCVTIVIQQASKEQKGDLSKDLKVPKESFVLGACTQYFFLFPLCLESVNIIFGNFYIYLKYKTVTRLKGITNATKVEHIIKYRGALAFSFQGTAHQAEAGISSFVYSLVKQFT